MVAAGKKITNPEGKNCNDEGGSTDLAMQNAVMQLVDTERVMHTNDKWERRIMGLFWQWVSKKQNDRKVVNEA